MTATTAATPADDHDHIHDHSAHEHGETGPRVDLRPLAVALGITLVTMVAEVFGGWLSGSLALIADAAHMATDAAALALAMAAAWLARRAANATYSYGFLRAEILAALVNAVALVVIAIFIFREAWDRWSAPPEVETGLMLVVGVIGLIANAVSAWVLSRGGSGENLNTRGAMMHVLGDLAGSAAAVIAAIVMMTTGWLRADPLLSALIGLLVLWSSFGLLRESVDILLEATPRGIDPEQIRATMAASNGVEGIHDLHVWSVTSGVVALSAHVETDALHDWHETLDHLATTLRDQFGITHVTLQPETPQGDGHRGCSLDSPTGRAACSTAPAVAGPRSRGHSHGHRH